MCTKKYLFLRLLFEPWHLYLVESANLYLDLNPFCRFYATSYCEKAWEKIMSSRPKKIIFESVPIENENWIIIIIAQELNIFNKFNDP